MDGRLINIIKHYKRQGEDRWVTNTCNQSSLSEAIKIAALSIDSKGKRNPHQRFATTWDKSSLEKFANELLKKEQEINSSRDFDELLAIVSSVQVIGIGKLTHYDTAFRIGMFLKIQPQKIFLHAGTRVGAERMLGKISKPYITKTDLPKEFANLECWQIEDILCLYKHMLKPVNN